MKESDFGEKLIEIRKVKGLTQEEVAEKCNITTRTIQRIESGIVKPRAFTIKIISNALGFDFFEALKFNGDDAINENQNSNAKKFSLLWYLKDLFNLKTNAMKKLAILMSTAVTVCFTVFILTAEGKSQPEKKSNEVPGDKLALESTIQKTESRIQVAFKNNLTFDSLVYVRNDLKAKGIIINYRKIEFDDTNHLSAISCEVDCNDGFKGSFAMSSLNSINKDKRIGFYRDYSKNAKIPFGTGGF